MGSPAVGVPFVGRLASPAEGSMPKAAHSGTEGIEIFRFFDRETPSPCDGSVSWGRLVSATRQRCSAQAAACILSGTVDSSSTEFLIFVLDATSATYLGPLV
jgi:hypothetical protein